MSRESRFAALVIAGLAFASTAPATAAVFVGVPYTHFSWTGPGKVAVAQPSAVGLSFGVRSLTVKGIQVSDIPGPNAPYATTPQSAQADVYIWRWNGTSWGPLPYARGTVRSNISRLYNYNSVVLRDLSFSESAAGMPLEAGYYTVTVRIRWFSYDYTLIGERHIHYDSKADYGAITGNVVPGPGYVYIY